VHQTTVTTVTALAVFKLVSPVKIPGDRDNNGSGNDRLFVVPAVVTREIQLRDGMGVGQGHCVDFVPDTSVETSVGSATTASRAQEAIVGATTALVWLNGCAVSLRWVGQV
jgi:hypothetical protein